MFNSKLSILFSIAPAVLNFPTPSTSFTPIPCVSRKQCSSKSLRQPSFINTNNRLLQYSHMTSFMSSFSEDEFDEPQETEVRDNTNKRKRLLREKRESLLKERYVMGNELIELRERINHTEKLIKHSYKNALVMEEDVDELKKQVRELRSRDAEFVYGVATKEMKEASDEKEKKKWTQIAIDARSCIPHFNLEGLWVGKYGSHGYEMINITYVGDNLIAYKVTGDKNVPRGEITFQADLTPSISSSSRTSSSITPKSKSMNSQKLDPIQLTETAAKQWGVKQLQRYPGLGHVADIDFTRNQWLDGQFIMIGQSYFSFAWVPIGTQIFFGRPSEELIMNMMREKVYMTPDTEEEEKVKLSELDVDAMRTVASRSMEETVAIMEEENVSESANQIDFENMEGCWE